MKKLLIIIPAFNEEKSLPKLLKAINDSKIIADIVVVNDCSTDNTLKAVNKEGIVTLNLPINLGIGGAMQTGYKFAAEKGYDLAVQVDGDGQHLPSEINKLLKVQEESGANMVIGSRFLLKKEYQQKFLRMLGIYIFTFIVRLLTGQKITDATSGFRLVDKKVIKLFSDYYPTDYPEPEVLIYLNRRGMKAIEIPVKMNQREEGKSSITFVKSIYYMIKVISSMILEKIRSKNA